MNHSCAISEKQTGFSIIQINLILGLHELDKDFCCGNERSNVNSIVAELSLLDFSFI